MIYRWYSYSACTKVHETKDKLQYTFLHQVFLHQNMCFFKLGTLNSEDSSAYTPNGHASSLKLHRCEYELVQVQTDDDDWKRRRFR